MLLTRLFFILALIWLAGYQSLFAQAHPDPVTGGAYQFTQTGNGISPALRKAIQENLKKQTQKFADQGQISLPRDKSGQGLISHPLVWPVRQRRSEPIFQAYGLSNFVDHNPDFPGEVLDYNCGTRSFDLFENHTGTDIFSWPFAWEQMDNNQLLVVAAAPGIILDKMDGNDDKNCFITQLNRPWNAVFIRHEDGSVAWYGNLKQGSLTGKDIGEPVAVGEYLGVVGSSGNSSSPHLHFELYDAQGELTDPFAGPCNPTVEQSLWKEQRPYFESGINQISTHLIPPNPNLCYGQGITFEKQVFMPGDVVFLALFLRDQVEGEPLSWQVKDPQGQVFWSVADFQPSIEEGFFNASYWVWDMLLPAEALPGTYLIEAQFADRTYTHAFEVAAENTPIAKLGGDLELWEVPVNTQKTGKLLIQNIGNATLVVEKILYPEGFSGPSDPVEIEPGLAQEIAFDFDPTESRFYEGFIKLMTTNNQGMNEVAVSGVGVGDFRPTRVLGLSGDLQFGEVILEDEATRKLLLSNQGTVALKVDSLNLPQPFRTDWTGGEIPAQSSVEIEITFRPNEAINYEETLTAYANTLYGLNVLNLTGTGVDTTAQTFTFSLVNPETDQIIRELTEGDTIRLPAFGLEQFNILINTERTDIGSLLLEVQGAENFLGLENTPPYLLFGDEGLSDYLGGILQTGNYQLTLTPFSETGAGGVPEASTLFSFRVEAGQPRINEFVLVNAETNQDIQTLSEGSSINLNEMDTPFLNVRANTQPGTTSQVNFFLEGPVSHQQEEEIVPFALFGDEPQGDYRERVLCAGQYTLKALPLIAEEQTLVQGDTLQIDFEIVNDLKIERLWLVNAELNQRLFSLPADTLLDVNLLGTDQLTIEAESACAGSVQFQLFTEAGELVLERTESWRPFALVGEDPFRDYTAWDLESGRYLLRARPFSEKNLQGTPGVVREIRFTLPSDEQNAPASSTKAWLETYPNPIGQEDLKVRFLEKIAGEVQFRLIKPDGASVLSQKTHLETEQSQISVDTSNWQSGMYYLEITTSGKAPVLLPVIKY